MIRFNDRVLVLGSTGSGKSELLNGLFTDLAGGAQRLLVDTKGEFRLPGVQRVRDVDALDWSAPLLHYVDRTGQPDEFEQLFAACYRRRRLVVCLHEASDVCAYDANRTPPSFNAYVSKGRALGLGLLAGSQRPVQVPVRVRSEADHVFLFARRFVEPADHKAAAVALNRDAGELARTLDEVRAQLGDHSFLHFDRRENSLVACPPLHAAARAAIMVDRPNLY